MKTLAFLFPVAGLLGLYAWIYSKFNLNRRPPRSEVVVKDEFEKAAAANYRLLQRSARAIQRVLDEDAAIPSLTKDRREELEAIVREVNR